MREGKARETAEKKARKETERTAAREEVAREKAARAAEKEAKKTQKTRETELHKAEAEKKRAERAQGKKKTLKLPKLVKRDQLMIVRLMGLGSAHATYDRRFAINHQ